VDAGEAIASSTNPGVSFDEVSPNLVGGTSFTGSITSASSRPP
jgi:hypothetical protein